MAGRQVTTSSTTDSSSPRSQRCAASTWWRACHTMYIGIGGQGRGGRHAGQVAQQVRLQPSGHGGQQVAAADERRQAREARHHDGKAALDALRGQVPVQVQRAARLVHHGDVVGGQVVGAGVGRLAHGRVVEHAVAVFEQTLLQHVGTVGRARADDKLAVLAAQHFQAGHVGRNHAQHHAGRGPAQARHQRGQQQVALEVVGGDGEGGLPARRVKFAGARKTLQLAQQLARLRCQRLGPCGGHDATAGLDEQRVARDGPQLVQQVAHGRLRDAQALRRAGDAAGLHHGHQQLQQPRIKV